MFFDEYVSTNLFAEISATGKDIFNCFSYTRIMRRKYEVYFSCSDLVIQMGNFPKIGIKH